MPAALGVALLFGAALIPDASSPPASSEAQAIQAPSTFIEAGHTAPAHPCHRSGAAPVGSCAVAGFSAGLTVSSIEFTRPVATDVWPRLAYASLAQQWRGIPPDRPPRS